MTQNSYTNAQNTPNLVSSVTNGPFGPSSYTLGNGLGTAKTYDTLGRNAGVWVCSGSTSPYCTNATQIYGNTTSFSGTRATEMCDTILNQCQAQVYDGFNRLTAVSGGSSKYSYSYDRYGNRLTQTSSPSGPAPSYSFNNANQIVGLAYDAAGNLMGDGISHSFTYDAEGNVISVDNGSTATYVYDALNRRVSAQTSSGSLEYVYNAQGQRTSSWSPNGSSSGLAKEGRIYWDGQQIAYRAFDGSTYFQHKSPLGTDRVRTNYQGMAVTTETSLAFGDGFSQSNSNSNGPTQDNDQYAGLEHDAESFSEHATFRQYSSTQGRWMSPDPYDGSYDLTNPQSLNRYAYVLNNPFSYKDPQGKSCVDGSFGDPGGGGGDGDYGDGDIGELDADAKTHSSSTKLRAAEESDNGDGQGCAAAGIAPGNPNDPNTDQNQGPGIDVNAPVDPPISGTLNFNMNLNQFIEMMAQNGFNVSPLDTALGLHSGINFRDSNSTCSTHVNIDPFSGQYGNPITGSLHIDEFNPLTRGPMAVPQVFYHFDYDVVPDVLNGPLGMSSVTPGNTNCPHS